MVAIVKDLHSYIQLHANSESDMLNGSMVVVDVVVVVHVDVDTLGIGTGLSVKDRGGDNLDRTDLVIISPGRRSNFPPNFLRSRKLRNVGSDIFSNGKSKSN